MEDAIQNVWITIFAGVLLWFIKEGIGYSIARQRIKAGIISDINKHISGASRQKQEAKKIKDKFIKWGKHFPFPINYSLARWAFYASIQKDLPKYLREKELLMVMNIYQLLWEIDVSFEGFTKTINACENKEAKINQIFYARLNEQFDSIMNRIAVLGVREIITLDDLQPVMTRMKNNTSVD